LKLVFKVTCLLQYFGHVCRMNPEILVFVAKKWRAAVEEVDECDCSKWNMSLEVAF